jgi:hypothetical protein
MAAKKNRLPRTSKVHDRMKELAKQFPENPELRRYRYGN